MHGRCQVAQTGGRFATLRARTAAARWRGARVVQQRDRPAELLPEVGSGVSVVNVLAVPIVSRSLSPALTSAGRVDLDFVFGRFGRA